MSTLAFVCPTTGKSVFADLEIDRGIYSSILKTGYHICDARNAANHMSFPRWFHGLPKITRPRARSRLKLSGRATEPQFHTGGCQQAPH
jgi:hypothetical protein